jgi:predicted NBD/HSP70 family sugar kinase
MYLAIDIGGTSIKYGIIEEMESDIKIINNFETPTNAKILKAPGIENKIIELAKEMTKKYELEGVAISTAGMVNPDSGEIIYANENIPDYTGINLKKVITNQFNLPCEVENDVNAAALGEYAYGAGKGHHGLLCITVGTGIGGALIIDDEIYRGHSFSAGEIGYMIVEGKEFQKIASTTALVSRVRERDNTNSELNGNIILERAKNNDSICIEEISKTCDIIAQGISNCSCMLNPEMVILGGGIMAQEDYLRPIIEFYLKKYMNEDIFKNTKLCFAKLGNFAGMIGAYYKLKQKIFGIEF